MGSWPPSHTRHPAVDDNLLPGHERGVIRRQEEGGARDLLRCPEAVLGNALDERLLHRVQRVNDLDGTPETRKGRPP